MYGLSKGRLMFTGAFNDALYSPNDRTERLLESVLSTAAIMVFTDGEGISSLSESSAVVLDKWIAEQMVFLANLFKALREARTLDDRNKLRERRSMWIESLDALASMAIMDRRGGEYGTWKRGATHDSCATCRALDGTRELVSWFLGKGYIPQQKGSKLDCGGFNCQCSIFNDYGDRIV